MKSNKLYKLFLFLLFSIIAIYVFLHYLTMSPESGIDFLYGLAIVCGLIIVLLSYVFSVNLFKILSINFITVMFFIIVLEVAFFSRIIESVGIRPIPINFNIQKPNVVNLDRSPWFKFASNAEISSYGWRGMDFSYTWKTDSLGYKNIEQDQGIKKFDYVAVGDSFTEGMGALVEYTWPSIINTISSSQVYNAGVQGYSSSQYLGTVKYLHNKISFDGIIIGHSPKNYQREKNFVKIPKKATGGIETVRINETHKGLALPQLLKTLAAITNVNCLWQDPSGSNPLSEKKNKNCFGYGSIDISSIGRREFISYINDIPDSDTVPRKNDLKQNEYWQILIKNYKKIYEYCKLNNKELIIASFPFRYEVYFSPSFLGFNSKFDLNHYIEFELLKEELSKLDIKFVDTFPALARYSKGAPKDKLPYFEKDGHFNRYGNKIIAKSISSSF